MPFACSVVGCTMKKGTNLLSQVRMFSFPKKDLERRKKWIVAMRRKDWVPKSHSKVCNRHFITGKPSLIRNHPDWVPSLYMYKSKDQSAKKLKKSTKKLEQSAKKLERYSQLAKRQMLNQTPDTSSNKVTKKGKNQQLPNVSAKEEEILIEHIQIQNELLERIVGTLERIEKSVENFNQPLYPMDKYMNCENIKAEIFDS